MQVKKEIELVANYNVTKASNETLANIYCEYFQGSKNSEILGKIKNEDQWIIKSLTNILKDYNGKYKNQIKVIKEHNKIPDVLRVELAKLISGQSVTATFEANYLALWWDATPPANWDTQLWSETLRGEFTSRGSTSNTAFLDKFFGSVDVAWNTYLEVWVFVDGTASANSWFLLSRVNINETMWPNETLTINVSIAITSAT